MITPKFQEEDSKRIYRLCKWIYGIMAIGYWAAVPIIAAISEWIDEMTPDTGIIALDFNWFDSTIVLFIATIPLYLSFVFSGQLVRTAILRYTNSISKRSAIIRTVIWSLCMIAPIVLPSLLL
ncbi:MAG: hypothetical protein J6R82_03805 [Clostridia bacterium]|nr:hypothetical protein [Clostridia bacterium]